MTKARRFGPNGDPGSNPAGGSALKRLEQQGHTPPCSDTRVTSGAIRGISTRSYSSQTICVTPDTSAPQPLQVAASTACFAVGLGCSGRCAPRCGLAFALGAEAPDGFCPFDGGTLELSGVRRQAQLDLKLGHPRRQCRILRDKRLVARNQRLDPRHQRGDQRVLVMQITKRSHLYGDSYSPGRRNRKTLPALRPPKTLKPKGLSSYARCASWRLRMIRRCRAASR